MNSLLKVLRISLCTLLFSCGFFYLNAQTLRGRILQHGTNEAIPYASIYLEGMQKGTASNDSGYFSLPISSGSKIPVVISAVGYYSKNVPEYSSSTPLIVHLNPKSYVLETVVIGIDNMSREEKEEIFKTQFLGTTANSSKCIIENFADVRLVYNKKSMTLRAFCDNPIKILNQALGYRITYFLDAFRYSPRDLEYQGFYYFEELISEDPHDQKRVNRRRMDAYYGSRMHFIRALYNNSLAESDFTVLNRNYDEINCDSLVVNEGDKKKLKVKDRLRIIYKNDRQFSTYIGRVKELNIINELGFYENGLKWSGYMATQRMGDLLPFEYQPPIRRVKN
jgi:hypothetical protein